MTHSRAARAGRAPGCGAVGAGTRVHLCPRPNYPPTPRCRATQYAAPTVLSSNVSSVGSPEAGYAALTCLNIWLHRCNAYTPAHSPLNTPRTDAPSPSRYTQLRTVAVQTSSECRPLATRALHQSPSFQLNSKQHGGSSRDRQLSLGSGTQRPNASLKLQ